MQILQIRKVWTPSCFLKSSYYTFVFFTCSLFSFDYEFLDESSSLCIWSIGFKAKFSFSPHRSFSCYHIKGNLTIGIINTLAIILIIATPIWHCNGPYSVKRFSSGAHLTLPCNHNLNTWHLLFPWNQQQTKIYACRVQGSLSSHLQVSLRYAGILSSHVQVS